MPDDDIVIPADLLDLQCRAFAAQALVEAFGRAIDREVYEVFPEPDQYRQRMWPEGGDERAEHERLREERNAALDRIWEHPAMAAARADGTRVRLDSALKKRARQLVGGA